MKSFNLQITHDDNDGLISIIPNRLTNPECKVLQTGYNSEKIHLEEFIGKNVLFTDFCYDYDYMIAIKKVANKLIVIDHHKLDQRLIDADWVVHEFGKAGCYLAWRYFFPDTEMPPLIVEAHRRDVFKQEENTDFVFLAINSLFGSYGMEKSLELLTKHLEDIEPLISIGKAIMPLHHEALGADEFEKVQLKNGEYLYFTKSPHPTLGSDKAKAIYTKHSDCFAVVLHYPIGGEKAIGYGFRTNRDIDLSLVANTFVYNGKKGGGHPNACGFTMAGNVLETEVIKNRVEEVLL